MQSFIEPLYKSRDQIQFGWEPEPGAVAYRMYVGLSSVSLSLLYDGIAPAVSKASNNLGKVPYTATIVDVLTVLGITGKTFLDTRFWFAITYTADGITWSLLSDSTVVEVPPVGISSTPMRDDPQRARHLYVFSPELQRWVKMAGTSTGSIAVSTSDFFSASMTTEYTYDGTNVATVKTYPSDATTGDPAKLTTYTWIGSQLSKTVTSDTTV